LLCEENDKTVKKKNLNLSFEPYRLTFGEAANTNIWFDPTRA